MIVNIPLFTSYLPCEQVVYTYVLYIKLNQLATSLGHLGNCVAFTIFWSLIVFFFLTIVENGLEMKKL
jgi:hypothetical protein